MWRAVELPGRGTTFACDLPGPSPHSPTVVMLHGLGATGALNWSHGLEVLNERFRVVALDHRGHGRGIDADEPFTLEDCADDAVALADVLGVERAIFVGYSMGGPIAQLVWHRHAERVQGLVLCATSAEFCSPAERWAVVRALEELHRTTRLIPRPLVVEGTRAALAGFLVGAAQRQDLLDAVRRHDPRGAGTRHTRCWASRRRSGSVTSPCRPRSSSPSGTSSCRRRASATSRPASPARASSRSTATTWSS